MSETTTNTTDSEILVVARCEAGHVQEFRVRGMSLEWAQQWAGLMDGTSPLYVSAPGESEITTIGRCSSLGPNNQTCRARIRCDVYTSAPPPPRNVP